jgi:hypothetical protein
MEYIRVTVSEVAGHYVLEVRSAIPWEDMVWSDYRFMGDLKFSMQVPQIITLEVRGFDNGFSQKVAGPLQI